MEPMAEENIEAEGELEEALKEPKKKIKKKVKKEVKKRTKKKIKKEPVKAPDKETKDEIISKLMNISGIGISKATSLYEAGFKNYNDLREASIPELANIKGIGPVVAKIIKKMVESKKFKD